MSDLLAEYPLLPFFLGCAGAIGLLALLWRSARIFPHWPLVLLSLLPACASLGLFAGPSFRWPVWGLVGIVGGLAAFDLFTVPRARRFSLRRQTGRIASLGKLHEVELEINNHATRSVLVRIRDGVPAALTPDPAEFVLLLEPLSRTNVSYNVRPNRRGRAPLEQIDVQVRSRLGLWRRLLRYEAVNEIHVYPDLKQLDEYALLARTNRLSLLGVRRVRRVGQDHEFERLRDYTPDDNYKHIAWRVSARRQKLTVKDFQSSQSQRLLFLLDCGRMMTNEAAGLTLLDHALNSLLLLSYVALGRGDSVGLLCFSDEIHSFVPPRGGPRQMNVLLHAAFDRFPRRVESRYDEAFLYLAGHARKRSLVILLSNVIDDVNAQQIRQYMQATVGRHLPLAVLLRDRRLFEAVDVIDPQGPDLYRAAAAADILSWRRQLLHDLHRNGVLHLDVFPEQLTGPLISQYLEIKARHLL